MPGQSALPARTWTVSGDASVPGVRPSRSATSGDQATRRGAGTGVGETLDQSAPMTCRERRSSRGSPGTASRKRVVNEGMASVGDSSLAGPAPRRLARAARSLRESGGPGRWPRREARSRRNVHERRRSGPAMPAGAPTAGGSWRAGRWPRREDAFGGRNASTRRRRSPGPTTRPRVHGAQRPVGATDERGAVGDMGPPGSQGIFGDGSAGALSVPTGQTVDSQQRRGAQCASRWTQPAVLEHHDRRDPHRAQWNGAALERRHHRERNDQRPAGGG